MQQMPEGIDSTFRYILIAARRAAQLIDGARPRLSSRHAKPATVALAELLAGQVPWQQLTAEEYELMREQQLREQEGAEEAIVPAALPRPLLPPVEEPEAEEEGEEFADDLDDAEFEEDLEELEEAAADLLETPEESGA